MKQLLMACLIIFFVVALVVALIGSRASAAPDVPQAGNAFQLIDVAVGTPIKVSLSGHDVLFAHTNKLSDGTTTSTAGDYIVIMNANVAMDATMTAGTKCIVFAGGSASFRGTDASYIATDSIVEVQLQAVGHSAKVQIVKGSLYGSGK